MMIENTNAIKPEGNLVMIVYGKGGAERYVRSISTETADTRLRTEPNIWARHIRRCGAHEEWFTHRILNELVQC